MAEAAAGAGEEAAEAAERATLVHAAAARAERRSLLQAVSRRATHWVCALQPLLATVPGRLQRARAKGGGAGGDDDDAAVNTQAAAVAAALQTKDDEEETLRAALEVQTRRAEDAEAHLDAAQVQHREEQQGAHAKYRQQCSADVIVHDLQRELAAARAAAAAAAAETAAARQDASEATRSMREVTAASAAVEEEMEARASARARDHDRDKEEAAMCRLREVPKPCYPLP